MVEQRRRRASSHNSNIGFTHETSPARSMTSGGRLESNVPEPPSSHHGRVAINTASTGSAEPAGDGRTIPHTEKNIPTRNPVTRVTVQDAGNERLLTAAASIVTAPRFSLAAVFCARRSDHFILK